MNGFVGNIEELTKNNTFFRQVLFTSTHSQLVLMCLKPGKDIGMEVHHNVDQFFRIDQGNGEVFIDGVKTNVTDGFVIVVPAGSTHNLVNTGMGDLKLYTVYSPANHPPGTVHKTRQEAMDAEQHHD